MTRAEELKKSLMDMMEKWTGSLENEWSCYLTHEKLQFEDTLGYYTSAVREEERERQETAYRKGEY